eukprot:12440516-Prorocentrum_lima.AAC.1
MVGVPGVPRGLAGISGPWGGWSCCHRSASWVPWARTTKFVYRALAVREGALELTRGVRLRAPGPPCGPLP